MKIQHVMRSVKTNRRKDFAYMRPTTRKVYNSRQTVGIPPPPLLVRQSAIHYLPRGRNKRRYDQIAKEITKSHATAYESPKAFVNQRQRTYRKPSINGYRYSSN